VDVGRLTFLVGLNQLISTSSSKEKAVLIKIIQNRNLILILVH
jgi:hypothetical protein